jgi:integrase
MKEAKIWARAVESSVDAGKFVDPTPLKKTSLKDIFKRYRLEVTPSKKGHHSETLRLQALERSSLGDLALMGVSAPTIAAYRDRLAGEGKKPATINRTLNLISSVLNHARREWTLNVENPLRDVRRPPSGPGRDRRLLPGEEERLFGELARARNSWLVPLIGLALETAMRRGELLALDWGHVDLERRVAHLPDSKNGRPRGIPLSPRAAAILEDLKDDERPSGGPVFRATVEAVKLAFQRAVKRAGLSDFRFHDLRHEAISRLAERGDLSILEVAAISGHRDLRMLQRYTHLSAGKIAQKLATTPTVGTCYVGEHSSVS